MIAAVGRSPDRFQAELEAFHEAVTGGPPFPSGAAEAAEDIRFLQRLIVHLAHRHGFAAGGESLMMPD